MTKDYGTYLQLHSVGQWFCFGWNMWKLSLRILHLPISVLVLSPLRQVSLKLDTTFQRISSLVKCLDPTLAPNITLLYTSLLTKRSSTVHSCSLRYCIMYNIFCLSCCRCFVSCVSVIPPPPAAQEVHSSSSQTNSRSPATSNIFCRWKLNLLTPVCPANTRRWKQNWCWWDAGPTLQTAGQLSTKIDSTSHLSWSQGIRFHRILQHVNSCLWK